MTKNEKHYLKTICGPLVGVDEAGRGPLAGPVVAAAVLYDEKLFHRHFGSAKDSKMLSRTQREAIYANVLKKQVIYGVGIVENERIDEINILNATFEAMRLAVLDLEDKLEQQSALILVDGNRVIKNLPRPQVTLVKGDRHIKTISIASIIAKVTRDTIMLEHDRVWPQYGFANHMGYGTVKHLENIKSYGFTSIHRTSFKPKALFEKSKV